MQSRVEMSQDSEVKFDTPPMHLEMQNGEYVIDRLEMIEDTKGNPGDRGRLLVTNLRIIWQSIEYPRINLSIGYNNFVSATTKVVNTIFRGTTQALHIMTSYRNTHYEFIFSNLDARSTRHYTSVMGVYKAYISSRMYRELKLRAGIIHENRLILLPRETVYDTYQGVWNLSSEQGNVGTFIVTNSRLVWYADINHQFNVSLPYLAIANVSIRNSKFGRTLVVTSSESSGSFILGFRIDPLEKLQIVHKQIISLFAAYHKSPIFGVEYTVEYQASTCEPEVKDESISEFDESENEISNVFAMYFAAGGSNQRKPVMSNYLGLATEEPLPGSTLETLWELCPTSK